MFHFPGFASQRYKGGYSKLWVSPFGHLRIKGYKSPPRSISQVSHVLHRFLSLGIHRAPFMSPVRKPEHHNVDLPYFAIFFLSKSPVFRNEKTRLGARG
jgi:hypothetical protein